MKRDSAFNRLHGIQVPKLVCPNVLLLIAVPLVVLTAAGSVTPVNEKRIIGPVVDVDALGGSVRYVGRVDTGATTCSLHVDKWKIADESPDMAANVGKAIRFLTTNRRGESEWVERTIAEMTIVKTPDCAEPRYKVPMTLSCKGVEKNVLVTLNDRSHMTYALLLGRNFLDGDFLVDVSQHKPRH